MPGPEGVQVVGLVVCLAHPGQPRGVVLQQGVDRVHPEGAATLVILKQQFTLL